MQVKRVCTILHKSSTLLKIVSVPQNTVSDNFTVEKKNENKKKIKNKKLCYTFHNVFFLRIIFEKMKICITLSFINTENSINLFQKAVLSFIELDLKTENKEQMRNK